MAVTQSTLLTGTYNGTDATSYTTASVTPTAARLQLLTVMSAVSTGTPNIPTVTGCGLTWVRIGGFNFSATHRITVFRALGLTPTAGTLTIDFASGGVSQTQTYGAWGLTEFANVDQSGTNGSGAIVQTVSANSGAVVTTLTVTLAAFSNVNNATFGALGVGANRTITEGAGFTQLSEIAGSSPGATLATEWKNSNDTSVDWSWTTGSGASGVGVEIKEGPPAWVGGGAVAADIAVSGTGRRTRFGSAAVAVDVAVSGTGRRTRFGSAAVAGAVAVAGSGVRKTFGSGAITANVAVSGTGARTAVGSGAVSAAVAISAAGSRTATGSAAFSVAVGVSASGLRTAVGSGAVSAALTLSGTGVRSAVGAAAVAVGIEIAGAGQKEGSKTGQGAIDIALAVASAGSRTALGSGAVAVTTGIASAGLRSTFGYGAVAVAFAVSAAGQASKAGSASIVASLAISATGSHTGIGSADVPISVAVSAGGKADRFGAAAINVHLEIGAKGDNGRGPDVTPAPDYRVLFPRRRERKPIRYESESRTILFLSVIVARPTVIYAPVARSEELPIRKVRIGAVETRSRLRIRNRQVVTRAQRISHPASRQWEAEIRKLEELAVIGILEELIDASV
jgi:hypothetical protein